MYRLVILSIVAVSALAADSDDKSKCVRLFHPHAIRCCKKTSEVKEKMMKEDDIKECFHLPKDPISCEHLLCIAKKKSFATDDGKLDMEKFEEGLTKEMVSDPDVLADIKLKCINGDLEKYGPPEFCDFSKMRHCVSMQILNRCPEWKDSADCNELKEMVGDCV